MEEVAAAAGGKTNALRHSHGLPEQFRTKDATETDASGGGGVQAV